MNNNPNINQCPEKELSIGKKFKYSFFSALIFFFVSSPVIYQIANKIFGHHFNIAEANGCPTNSGLLLHTFIFFVIIFITMIIG